MVKNKLAIRGIRLSLSIVSVFILLILSTVPSFAYTYTNEYPFYLPYVGAKYVEVESSTLGRCSLVLSASVPDNYISIGLNNSHLYNNTSSTLYGTVRTRNGSDYSVRFSAFSTPEYYISGGYNPTFTPLNITEIYNTNIKFVDYSDSDKQNDTFIVTDNITRYDMVLSFVKSFCLIVLLFVVLIRRSEK